MQKKLSLLSLLPLQFVFLCSFALSDDWQYTIKKGDNIWDFSHNSLTDWRHWNDIVKLNKIKNEYTLKPGSKIIIPDEWVKHKPSKINTRKTHGQVTIEMASSGRTLPLKPGMLISVGDIIKTGKNSNALLVLEDQTKVTLLEDSVLSFTTARMMGGAKVNASDIKAHIKKGRVNIYANPEKAPDNHLEILTTAGNSAVRGTRFRVNTDKNITRTMVLSGNIDVSNQQGKTSLPGGFGTLVETGKKPLPPINLPKAPELKDLSTHLRYLPAVLTLPSKQAVSAYRVQIMDQQEPELILSDRLINNKLTIRSDLPDGQYLLNICAINKQGLEGKFAQHRLHIDARPEPPFQQQPKADKTQPVGDIIFKWSAPLTSSEYLLEVARQTDFSKKEVIRHKLSTNHFKMTINEPGTYHWRISSIDKNQYQGPPSEVLTLRLVPIPERPELKQPSINEDTLNLKWRNAGDNASYQVQFSNTEDFSHIINDKTIKQPSFEIARPVSGTYYIRVKTIDSDNFSGPYSPTQKIEVTPKSYWPVAFISILFTLLIAL